jgi:toxin ParE1/3/4
LICYLLPQAAADLEEIGNYLSERSPRAAVQLVDAMNERWIRLLDYPFAGKARDDLRPGARCVIVGQYLTFYRVTDRGIEIVRILHGRRNITSDDIADETG